MGSTWGHVLSLGIWKIMLGLGRTLAVAAGVDFGAQWVMWGYSAAKETEHYYDLTGSLTFGTLTVTALALNHGMGALPPLRAALAGGLVLSWAARLGSFLFSRISADGKDSRFDGVRDNPSRFFVYWTVQGVWIFSTLSPVLVLASVSRAAAATAPLSAIGIAGGVLALAGLAIEEPQTRKSRPSRRSTPRSLSTLACGRSPAIQTTWARSCFGQACTASAPQASQPSLLWLPSPLPFPLPLSPTCSSTSVAFLLWRGRPTKSTEMIPSTSGMSRPPLFWFPAGTGPRSTGFRYRPPPERSVAIDIAPPERSVAERSWGAVYWWVSL